MPPISRRIFLKTLGAGAVGLALGTAMPLGRTVWAQPAPPFSQSLPLPGNQGLYGFLRPRGPLTIAAEAHTSAPGLVVPPALSYRVQDNGVDFQNPIFILKKGQEFEAELVNNLAEETIIHWHGLDAEARQAGHPSYAVGPGERYAYRFPVTNRSGSYWYHPHPHGRTARQSYLGLASLVIVEDEEENALTRELDLTLGVTDIPLLLQDKRLDGNGRLLYEPNAVDLVMGYLGDRILVNHLDRPVWDVGRRIVRFRVLNGSTARLFHLGLGPVEAGGRLILIGTDGGLLERPLEVERLFLAPGERADLLVDLTRVPPGQELFLKNLPFDPMHREMDHTGHGAAPPSSEHMGHGAPPPSEHAGLGNPLPFEPLPEGGEYPILKLRVIRDGAYDRRIPERLSRFPEPPGPAIRNRAFTLSLDPHRRLWTINGLTYDMNQTPIDVSPRGVETWTLVNEARSMPHPMHLHGYLFRVLERTGSPDFVKSLAKGDDRGRPAADRGIKDTVLVWPDEKVTLAVDFARPDYPGPQIFLFHCHNLEHEDQGMMLNVRVG